MLLIRGAVIIAAAIMLMPADEQRQAKIATTATAAITSAATFCDRNASTCAAGRDLWASFVKKAEFAGRLAADLVHEYTSQQSGARPVTEASQPQTPPPSSRGTLTPADLAPAWRGGGVQRTRT